MTDLQTRAEAGNVEAQYELSWRLALGQDYPPDDGLAVFWLIRAAEGGHSLAQNNLAARYLAGDGLPRDAASAYCWFQLAAESGDRKAGKNRDSARSILTADEIVAAKAQLETLRRTVQGKN